MPLRPEIWPKKPMRSASVAAMRRAGAGGGGGMRFSSTVIRAAGMPQAT